MKVKVAKQILHTALGVSVLAFVCDVVEIDWQLALVAIRDSVMGRGTAVPQLTISWPQVRNWSKV